MDPTYPLLPVFAFLGFTLCFVPLKWQFEAWNVGTLWYIFWAALSCINVYFNALVWVGNTVNSAPAWCEISIRITMAASVGISAAALAINRRLYEIASGPLDGVISKPQKQRALLIDSLLCGLFPALFVVCQLVIQRHRFDILEDVGCVPDLYDGLATYFLSSMWPILLGFGSVVYCTLAIRAFTASRATFSNNLAPHKHLTPTRFLRLAGLSFATTLYSFALGMLSIATIATASAAADLAPFSDIAQLPRAVWAARDSNELAVELTRWLGPVCALIFFAFFGLAVEARAGYMRGLTAISNAF
ncbi:fungal pheromone STE3G-protein-coupled receptor, partial [Mycena crocata]